MVAAAMRERPHTPSPPPSGNPMVEANVSSHAVTAPASAKVVAIVAVKVTATGQGRRGGDDGAWAPRRHEDPAPRLELVLTTTHRARGGGGGEGHGVVRASIKDTAAAPAAPAAPIAHAVPSTAAAATTAGMGFSPTPPRDAMPVMGAV